VRHAITKLSDVHFVCTEKARERVIRMGEVPERVFVTGCPSIDLAAEALADPPLTGDIFQRYGGVGPKLDLSDGYLVVMQHPVTSEYREARRQITDTLRAVVAMGLPVLWFWPNVDAGSDGTSKGIRVFREQERPTNIHFFRNMEPNAFMRLLVGSRCLVGNSSVGVRECSFLGVPVVNIGSRQTGRERGANVVDATNEESSIANAIRQQLNSPRATGDQLYGDGQAGPRIANLLAELRNVSIEKRLTY
jgi:UDP-hydrolysing UDP-N-acetyl-D-glucosamine 2-epimerase